MLYCIFYESMHGFGIEKCTPTKSGTEMARVIFHFLFFLSSDENRTEATEVPSIAASGPKRNDA